ncbi:hypothetical protein ACS0TY_030046 [Phlomoides rotata]
MLGGGGADGAIHRAAGPELRAACYEVPEVKPGVRCPTGEARITPNSLRVAKEKNIQYIAFTAISCGVYRYPYDEAATVAISTIKEFAGDFKEEKISKFISIKKTTRRSFNAEVRNRKEYRNPDFLLHAATYQDIDQIGSCFHKDVFDPHGYDKSDFYDELGLFPSFLGLFLYVIQCSRPAHIQNQLSARRGSLVVQ